MTDPARYAVIGHPVEHSRSPAIHAAFAAATGQHMRYDLLPAPADGFANAVRDFVAAGGRGLNVTLPFKQKAFEFADRISDRARAAGAVNTLTFDTDGTVRGDNTDGHGLLRDLTVNFGQTLAGRRILILGAGGAVRGVTRPLLASKPARLVIANRTAAKAEAIADLFADTGPVTACSLDDSHANGPFDLVINAISAGLHGNAPDLPAGLFRADGAACDMIYADEPTPFLRWAADQGVTQRRDGFGMLVEQAAESFCIWRGIRPDTQTIIHQLRPDMA